MGRYSNSDLEGMVGFVPWPNSHLQFSIFPTVEAKRQIFAFLAPLANGAPVTQFCSKMPKLNGTGDSSKAFAF